MFRSVRYTNGSKIVLKFRAVARLQNKTRQVSSAEADFGFVNGRCHFYDAIISNQAFHSERCHICFSLGLDKVETGYNLLME